MKKFLMLGILLLCFGCTPDPIVTYNVSRIRPDGVVERVWTIKASEQLVLYEGGGWSGCGHTYLKQQGYSRYATIYAPTGWLLKVEKVK